MRIAITKGEREDRVAVERHDGSAAGFTFPKKGPTPHDAFHFFVESELAIKRGFWGLVAGGMDPADVGALAAAGGHASAQRAEVPDRAIVELIQAERLVECFEAESWSDAADNRAIRAMAQAGWVASHVPPLALDDKTIEAIRGEIAAFARHWLSLGVGVTVEFEWRD